MKMFKRSAKLKGNYKLKVRNTFFELYDENGNRTYYERSDGYWSIIEYDKNGNRIYYEDSGGYWHKKEYDENGNELYYERSDGYWSRIVYDENGNRIYYEDSDGYWYKKEYDENGNELYFENSDGITIDSRPKKELTVEEIENNLGYKIKIIGGENNGRH